jgi:hypothetical protein
MRSNWLKLSVYPSAVIFVAAGLMAILFAWNSLNLVQVGMANFDFLTMYGREGFRDGGGAQLLQLLWHGVIALAAFFGFKICEVEILRRWRAWQDRL